MTAVAVAIVMFIDSCTGAEPEEGSDSSRSQQPRTSAAPTAGVAGFELAAEPLWRGDAGGLPEVMTANWDSAQFLDDALFLEVGGDRMASVNPANGEPHWTAGPELLAGNSPKYGNVELFSSTGRAPIARIGNEWVMFTSYLTGDNTQRETQVAALRVKDASALWKVPRAADAYDVVDADDNTVLLLIGARGGDQPAARTISAANGSTLWETPGVWPQFVAGDRILGAVSSKHPGLTADDSYVVGLDAATGQRVWSLEGRYLRSEVGFVVGDVTVVHVRPDSDQVKVVLIDVTTGAEIDQLGWGGANSCASDDSRLVACTLDEKPESPGVDGTRLVTFDVTQRTKHVSPQARARDMNRLRVKKVWRDYIFVEDDARVHGDWWAVDRDGVAVSDKFPGELIGVSDEYAAFQPHGGSGIAAVYQVKK